MNLLTRLFFDPVDRTADEVPHTYRLEVGRSAWFLPLLAGVILLLAGALIGLLTGEGHGALSQRFYFAYLTGYVFTLSIALGCLFFVMIQHITRSMWSSTVRRIPEFLMTGFPVLALLGLPLIFGMHDLYHWTHADLYDPASPHFDELLAGKRPYLNTGFFWVRMVIYFVVWIFLSQRLYRLSVRQDVSPDLDTSAKLRKVSAYGLPLYAITTAFASYDLLMSLDPHWFSTIYGVYFFSGAFFVSLAAVVLIAWYIQKSGKLGNVITTEHYHDLGKFMFAFTVFWAYIAFSQYMLIWYGNIPEETIWFRHRSEHGWMSISMLLLFGHFVIPFVGLITRASKRKVWWLVTMSVWFFLMHYTDLFWLAMPTMELGEAHPHGFSLHLVDIVTWLGHISLFAGVTIYRLTRHSLVPFNDAYFHPAVTFENA
jgi:hypothetical protein